MAKFPTEKFSITSRETVRDPVLLSVARSGTPKTRRLYSGPRRAFNLVLRGLTTVEKATVEIFLAANRMTAFEIEWCGVPTYGGAARFPTGTEYWDYPGAIIPLVGDYTIEASVYVEGLFNLWWTTLCSMDANAITQDWPAEFDITEDGSLYFNRGKYIDGTGAQVPGGYYEFWPRTPRIRAREWTRVACSWEQATSTVRLYMRGKEIGALAMPLAGVPTIPTLRTTVAGSWGTLAPTPWLVDEVRYWNVRRTPEQIAAYANVQMAGDEAGLIGCWHFDETSGLIARDATPNARDLNYHVDAYFAGEPGIIPVGQPPQWIKAGPVGYKPDTVFSVIEETGERLWSKDDGLWAVEIPVLEAA